MKKSIIDILTIYALTFGVMFGIVLCIIFYNMLFLQSPNILVKANDYGEFWIEFYMINFMMVIMIFVLIYKMVQFKNQQNLSLLA